MGRRTEEQKAKHREQQRIYAKKYPERIRESHRKYNESEKGKETNAKYYPIKLEKKRLQRIKENAKSIEDCNKDLYRKHWTLAEEKFLCDNYDSMTVYEIAKKLGRTIMAVERKRNKLGLKKGA